MSSRSPSLATCFLFLGTSTAHRYTFPGFFARIHRLSVLTLRGGVEFGINDSSQPPSRGQATNSSDDETYTVDRKDSISWASGRVLGLIEDGKYSRKI
ncbi:hypothetical protein EDB92DRAFT_1900337 [Lactarius akahatsu]|uniref:Uncharacterized protein n=1 Tax=Lactarius akahatsu TaxID=416441 RepID=A0AAD4L6W1_9AGAM|nr:hypothetical protein EDB92DRAFT_1921027 [Lactarius akahatsu]KAH8980547.1 hypothetical protein EDB92DRAFT_1900337 [Lactarius akahatsu]